MMRTTKFHLLALLVLGGLLLSAHPAGARKVTFETSVLFQTGRLQQPEAKIPYHQMGIALGAHFEPAYPWPFYLETGINMMTSFKRSGLDTPCLYRFELPLNFTYQWEPTAKFSMGPWIGAYGVANALVGAEDPSRFNKWQAGIQAGISIRPGVCLINVAYYRDLIPFNKTAKGPDGVRIIVGFCF